MTSCQQTNASKTGLRELNGIYQNIRGLRSRTTEMYQFSCQSQLDYIAITESWLNSNIGSGEIFNCNYIERIGIKQKQGKKEEEEFC